MTFRRLFRDTLRFGRNCVMIMALFPMAVLPPYAFALPEGGMVAAGNVSIASQVGRMDITQLGQAAIVNWQDFGIGAGEIVNIHQEANAALLNRVLGANPSEILGQLNASGRVFLINPNGVVVGKGASINAMEFVASALDVADQDFLNGGDLAFQGDSTASVINLGTITAANGDVILVAYQVANAGEITAAEGVAALAAGNDIVLSAEGDQRVLIKTSVIGAAGATGDGDGVDNSGVITAAQAELKAAGGSIYQLAINQTGYIHATGVELRDGRVLLTSEGGTLAHAGTIAAHNADGSGGEVLVGGDYRGGNTVVANAERTTVTADAVIDVSAQAAHADGGRAIVWADQQTDFAGKIEGQGGALGGDGAFAEVSGKHILNYHGLADLSAALGATGTLLLDPDQAIISTAADNQANGAFNNTVIADNLGTANVVVNASTFGSDDYRDNMSGEIIVNAPITWTSGNTLTLQAGNSIAVNADLTGTGGGIVFQVMGVTSDASVTADAAATITADSLTIKQNPDSAYTGYNPEPAQYRSINDILLSGVVNVGTLDIKTENRGIDGDITITNAANAIGTLKSSATSGTIKGDINIVDGSGGLIVEGDFSNVASSSVYDPGLGAQVNVEHFTTIVTTGDLTLASGAKLSSTTGKDVVLAAQGGSFINNAGASATTPGTGGRFLIYSDNPTDTTLGGLAATPVYNKTYAGNAPGAITQTGNRVLYSLAPTLTFTADNLSRLYGAANPALTYTVTGLVGSDTAGEAYSGTPTVATTALVTDDVGTKSITVAADTVVASDYDYQIAFTPGTLTINPAPLTITADDLAKSQRQENPTLTATFGGLVNGDTSGDFTGLNLATTADVNSGEGTYAITASGAVNANYDITFLNGVLTVNGLPTLLISADDLSILYGAALPTFTTSISGFNPGDDASIVSGLIMTVTAASNSPVGTYSIVPSGATAAGYLIDFASGTLTINQAALTITANNLSRYYGSANPSLSVTYSGFVHGEDASVISGLAVETNATTSSGIGTYVITPSGAVASNYAITLNPGTLTVDRAPLTLDVASFSKIYADPNPTLSATATGLVLGQTLATVGTLSLTTPASQLTDAGTYDITGGLTGSLLNNYDLTINQGQLTINPRPVSIELGSGTREYGEANPTITVAVKGDDPAGMSNFLLNNVTRGTTGTSATASSDVGTYATTITDMTAANPNFDISIVEGEMVVTPAPLTIRTNNASRLYGDANPAFTNTNTGLKLTDTVADVVGSLANTTSATVTSNVGGYAITPTGTALTANYDITFTPGTLTVNKAPLFIVPALSSRLYGDPDPTFTISATGLLNGDTADVVKQEQFSGSHPTWDVGPHSITILAATATNYDLTFGAGTMNVFARPLTITANDATREYGEANPAFTASFDNLASFDDADDLTGLTFSTVADVTSNALASGYSITPQGVTNANYDLTYALGQLVVTPAPLSVDLSAITREYGELTPTPTATVTTGLKNGDTISMLGLAYDHLALPTADVGTFAYEATVSNPNYDVAFNGGTQTITAAPLVVSVSDVLRTYGEANPDSYAVNLGGLKFAASVTDIVAITNPTAIDTGTGTYQFGAAALTGNYTITSVSGDIRIAPRPLNLDFTGLTRRYGDADFTSDQLISFLDQDGLVASFDNPADVLQLSTATNVASGIGSYDVAVNITDTNYMPGTYAGALAITPRPLTVVLNPLERVFGQDNPTDYDTFRVAGGDQDLMSFDAMNTVLNITEPAVTADVGNYTLTASLIDPNYTLTRFSGAMSVLPRPITLQMPDGFSRVYGDANPAVTGVQVLNPVGSSNSGLATFHTVDDVATYQLPDITAGVGVYSFNTTFNPNYDMTVIGLGSVTIDARPIAIGLPGFTRLYGDANPATTPADRSINQVSQGLASFDSIGDAVTITSLPGERADVGTHAVGWQAGRNYDVSIRDGGEITVNPRQITVELPGVSRSYGDADPRTEIGLVGGDGLASFETMDVLYAPLELPGARAAVGEYQVTSAIANDNYTVTVADGSLQTTVAARPVTFDLSTFARLYGEANPVSGVSAEVAGGDGLASFDTLADVLSLTDLPGTRADAGTYELVKETDSNYQISYVDGSAVTISPRDLTIAGQSLHRTYGDSALNVMTLGGDGFAPGDTFDDLFTIVTDLGLLNADSNAGYYPIAHWALLDEVNYRASDFQPDIVTILPRPITMQIANQTIDFENAQALVDFFGNENLGFDATAANLVAGDDFDDAFPIIRYQIVDTDTVPELPTQPTIGNVYLTDAATLRADPAKIGAGVDLSAGNERVSSNLPSITPGTVGANGVELNKFITVRDGYDTEENYVLTGVTNATIRLTVPSAVVSDSSSTSSQENSLSLADFTLSANPHAGIPANQQSLVVRGANEPPPSLMSFFAADHLDFGISMISGYIRDALGSEFKQFEAGGLLAEITRETGGTAADVTDFQIQRWLERNADNPAAMALLAEPLAAYATDFLNKDPSTYTAAESAFGSLLGEHMAQARDQYAERVQERHDEWVKTETARGSNLADVYGRDVPYKDFLSEGAADYMADTVEAATAMVVAGGLAAGTTAGATAAITTVTAVGHAIMPFAFGAKGTALFTGSVGLTVGGPVVIVAVAVVGSIARGIQVFEGAQQEGFYNDLQGNVGRTMDPSSFSLETASGKDDVVNQTIMLGALASFLLPGQ